MVQHTPVFDLPFVESVDTVTTYPTTSAELATKTETALSLLQDQTVPRFPDETVRDATWTTPPNGALCVTLDTQTIWQRMIGVWVAKLRPLTATGPMAVTADWSVPFGGPFVYDNGAVARLEAVISRTANFTLAAQVPFLAAGAIPAAVRPQMEMMNGASCYTSGATPAISVSLRVAVDGSANVEVRGAAGVWTANQFFVLSSTWPI
jgi:hypothetical protein